MDNLIDSTRRDEYCFVRWGGNKQGEKSMSAREKVGLLVSILGASASATGAAQAAESPSANSAVVQGAPVELDIIDTLIKLVKSTIRMEVPN
ncbi:hypothetical protein ACSRUE_41735 [Sorangium sp. KYC3313]|uniref:hypothetical protein n=1 Tax=Sorangium sp. KYC3313 TaxID=3449740 RepID=UPI003F8A4ECE